MTYYMYYVNSMNYSLLIMGAEALMFTDWVIVYPG